MNAVHTHLRPRRTVGTLPRTSGSTVRGIDWMAQIKLAVVLSAIAALVVVALAGRVAEPMLIVGVIVVASVVAWARVEPVAQPARVRSHHTR